MNGASYSRGGTGDGERIFGDRSHPPLPSVEVFG